MQTLAAVPDQNTNIIVTWVNNKTRRQECEVFEKAAVGLAYKYINMLKSEKICSNIKLYGATQLIELQ